MKKLAFFNADFISDPSGQRWTSNESIKEFIEPRLRQLKTVGFDCVKARPQSVKNLDPTVAVWFADLCLELGLEFYFHVNNAHNLEGNMHAYWRYSDVYDHEATKGVFVDDEPDTIEEAIEAKIQIDHIRESSEIPIYCSIIGEDLLRSGRSGDPFDGVKDDRKDTPKMIMDYLGVRPAMRHYAVRRDRGYVDQAYYDKMNLKFRDAVVETVTRYGSQSMMIVQAFGKGVDKERGSYWRLPYKTELSEMVDIVKMAGIETCAFYTVFSPKHPYQLIMPDMSFSKAFDGSYPIEAVAG